MKTRKKKLDQFLSHDINDEEEVEKYLETILPSIGYVVMYFNALENSLDKLICEIIHDDYDNLGLIVLHKMNYSSKVDLFKRLCENHHSQLNLSIESFKILISELKECGRLRNLVVHADWENTDNDNFTYVNLRISANDIEQEYLQFSERTLTSIILRILHTQERLFDYWDELNDKLDDI